MEPRDSNSHVAFSLLLKYLVSVIIAASSIIITMAMDKTTYLILLVHQGPYCWSHAKIV